MKGRCAPPPSPHPPDWSWFEFKRRNNTGSLRIPSRLAHRARPIRQCWADPTSSRLLLPSPPTHGSDCLQLDPTATTAEPRRSFTSVRTTSASWRTPKIQTQASRQAPANRSAGRVTLVNSYDRARPAGPERLRLPLGDGAHGGGRRHSRRRFGSVVMLNDVQDVAVRSADEEASRAPRLGA